MRNNELREFVNTTTKRINELIRDGVEPLSLAFILRNFAEQCDNLAKEYEKLEMQEANNETNEIEEVVENGLEEEVNQP